MDSSSAPNPADNGGNEEQTEMDEDSAMGSEHDDSSVEETETSSSVPLEKASLMGKSQGLEMMKERAVAEFDEKIAALKIVLSLK
jgi:hypothetical protein